MFVVFYNRTVNASVIVFKRIATIAIALVYGAIFILIITPIGLVRSISDPLRIRSWRTRDSMLETTAHRQTTFERLS